MTRVPDTGRRCSGKRKRTASSLRHSLEYPCVSRLRRRRLLSFLWRHGFKSTFEALALETKVFFSVARLQRLVRLGQWGEAIAYVSRFVPNVDLLGEDGSLFLSFLSIHKVIHSIAMRTPSGAVLTQAYERELINHPNPDLGAIKLISMLSALHRKDQLRNSINWHLVRHTAADIVKGLIARTPEFNHLLRLPDCRDKQPHNILPIRSCSRPRHHMKKIGRIPASHLAKFYLQTKRSLQLSLSRCEGRSFVSGLSCRAADELAKFVDLSVRAGMNRPVQPQPPNLPTHPTLAVPKRKREPSASCNPGMMEVSVCAKRKKVRRHPLEYPCVSRLRHRRLLAFFRWRSYRTTFSAFVHETNVFFSIDHLHRLVCQGQWNDAIQYVYRFVPSLYMLDSEGIVFFNFLQVHKALLSIAVGHPDGALMAEQRERNLKKYPNSDPGTVKLTRVLLTMLRCKHLRASIDWSFMRFKAAEIAKDLITNAPEFNDLLRLLPTRRNKPHNILPIRPCSHQRRHTKERKQTPASDIAKFYLQKKRSMPSSSQCEGNPVVLGLSCAESSWLADITVESVQAGICRVVRQGLFEGSCNEGFS